MRVFPIGILTFAVVVSVGACTGAAATGTGAERPTGTAAAEPAGRGASEAAADEGEPAFHHVTIPAGTNLRIVLDTPIASDTSRVEQPVRAHLAHPIQIQGHTALPSGSSVTGIVTEAVRSGKVKGRARLAVRFHEVSPRGGDERYEISTRQVARVAEGTKKKDALEIGAPAAGGALVGALVGGKKGALVGTAVGGGAGTAVVLTTRGKEVRLGRGAVLTLRLTEPLTVKVKG